MGITRKKVNWILDLDIGPGKPETFDFLGFTHICGTTRKAGLNEVFGHAAKHLKAQRDVITLCFQFFPRVLITTNARLAALDPVRAKWP